MKFNPKPQDKINLFRQEFTFQEHPNAPGMPFSLEGSRAFVYQLKDRPGRTHCLKVFKPRSRDARIAESQVQLQKLEKLPGLSAAVRRVVPPSDKAARQYPELAYAVFMPWIAGRTWAEMLMEAARKGAAYPKQEAVRLCTDFLETLSNLEGEKIAHTDISSSNVIFQSSKQATELLDLEDVYMPGAVKPLQPTNGTPNYQHQAGKITWCLYGDRYAGAVLASEILLLSDPSAARRATDTGYFAGNCTSPEARQRFDEAQRWFQREAPAFGELFHFTWWADSLENCPPIADLKAAAAKVPAGGRVQVFTPSVPECEPETVTPPKPLTFQPDAVHVAWEPIAPAGKQLFEWVQAAPPAGTFRQPAPRPVVAKPSSRRKSMGVALLVAFILLFLMWLIARLVG